MNDVREIIEKQFETNIYLNMRFLFIYDMKWCTTHMSYLKPSFCLISLFIIL